MYVTENIYIIIKYSKGTNFYYMFIVPVGDFSILLISRCFPNSNITTIPQINTSKGTNFSYLIKYIPQLILWY